MVVESDLLRRRRSPRARAVVEEAVRERPARKQAVDPRYQGGVVERSARGRSGRRLARRLADHLGREAPSRRQCRRVARVADRVDLLAES